MKPASRVSILVDGEAYFAALHAAMQKAHQSIIIVGWDLHSGLRLLRNGQSDEYPATLGEFLDCLVRKRKRLNIYLLSWDFAMIYAMEREFFPRYKLKWRTHKRIHFCLDGEHPVGASQHQKIVVIDDAVAFAGGLDISKWRWDTSQHRPDDERRIDPDGKAYPPFHDVQMMVDGEAAVVLGKLVRERWYRACGEAALEVNQKKVSDIWPVDVTPDFKNISVAISRTRPKYKEYDEIREVERLYLDSIARARSSIYIENQYLSSYRIGEAIAKRLSEENGPEVIIILPLKTGGWLEQHTMDVLRNRILLTLWEADVHDRLRVYYPQLATHPYVTLMVHAKVMIIDGCFARVGSSNLSNRSLGLDSECDLSIVGEEGGETAKTITSVRNRLLAEHLGVSESEVAEVFAESGSLRKAIDSLREGDRTLIPLKGKIEGKIDQWLPESELLDPEKPVEPEEFLDYFISPKSQRPAYHHFLKIIVMIVIVLLFAAIWRWTPLVQYLNIHSVTEFARWLEAHPFSPLLVPLAYVVLGLVSFPVTLLIMATIIVYGPWWGGWYALLGTTLSAVMVFLLGHVLGKNIVSRFSGSLVNRVNQRLSKSGLMAVIAFRVIPVAPFSLINLMAGVSAISLRDFFIGTLIGIIPGITAISFVADRLFESLRRPDITTFAALFIVVVLFGITLVSFRKWIKNRYLYKKKLQGS
ncbi:VTT domain-containing protein [Desulfopila sp. IMCC35008]|uniref:VTT domain-containing protein n=1 Tax=Desulfopila sp. IMCC35008 TaxID=2653858 RepID=UPI001F10C339|nr:VTT domain-containing protein [Desulfopila sp. IMCC35008]